MGYTLASYTSSNSVILTKEVMGDHVLLFEGAIIQPFVKIGDNVIIRSGSILGHHTIIESNCFIASRVATGGNVVVEENATIGLGAVISDGVRVGARSFIGAGAVVTSDTEPDGVYVGVPARRLLNKTSLAVTRQAGYDFGIK